MGRGAWWAAVHGVSKEFRHNLATGAVFIVVPGPLTVGVSLVVEHSL